MSEGVGRDRASITGGMLDATGERLVPDRQHGELVHAEHLARYRLAARLAAGRRVLDAASGEGYGTAMLAEAGAESVAGVDISAEAVAAARERYGLDYREADVAKLPFEDGAFDLVVCFETIEHVEAPERVLAELRRVLAPDGALLISTPNKRESLVDNEFHVREFEPEEFIALLEAIFPAVERLYQQNFLTSAVLDAGRLAADDGRTPLDVELTKVAGVAPGRELYVVALCGTALPELDASVAVAADVYEGHRLAQRTVEAERLLAEWHARATEAERIQADWEARATEAERIQADWEERATTAERNVTEWHDRATELQSTLDRIAASLSWRLTKPLRAVRGRERRAP